MSGIDLPHLWPASRAWVSSVCRSEFNPDKASLNEPFALGLRNDFINPAG